MKSAKFPRCEDATQPALPCVAAADSSNCFPGPSVDIEIRQDNHGSLVSPPGIPVLTNLAGLPIVPCRLRLQIVRDCELPDDNEAAKKKQKVAFSGAPRDHEDAQWYDDDRLPLEVASPAQPPLMNEEQVVPTITPNIEVPESRKRKRRPRTIARFDSEQASALFSNNHDFNASPSEDST